MSKSKGRQKKAEKAHKHIERSKIDLYQEKWWLAYMCEPFNPICSQLKQ